MSDKIISRKDFKAWVELKRTEQMNSTFAIVSGENFKYPYHVRTHKIPGTINEYRASSNDGDAVQRIVKTIPFGDQASVTAEIVKLPQLHPHLFRVLPLTEMNSYTI